MSKYPFQVVDFNQKPLDDPKVLHQRPFTKLKRTFIEEARYYVPGEQLETGINTAIAAGEPLLITGEPGTGKSQAAYYAAYKLNVEPVYHFQVKSDTTAKDLLYHFDTVRYFHEAQLAREKKVLNKKDYVEKRALWQAMESEIPRVILIDEIDKAPRDFPNDLLHELDKMEFTITETEEVIQAPVQQQPIVFITSNSERRLPEPFLRRCVYHHIRFDQDLLEKAIQTRGEQYGDLPDDFIKMAIQRFLALRSKNLRKVPSTGEFLVWLRILALRIGSLPQQLEQDLSKLPYLGVLLKDHQDIEDVSRGGL